MVVVERPKTDRDVCATLQLAPWQLQGLLEYIEKGTITIISGDCEKCGGVGRWDDIECNECKGTGEKR